MSITNDSINHYGSLPNQLIYFEISIRQWAITVTSSVEHQWRRNFPDTTKPLRPFTFLPIFSLSVTLPPTSHHLTVAVSPPFDLIKVFLYLSAVFYRNFFKAVWRSSRIFYLLDMTFNSRNAGFGSGKTDKSEQSSARITAEYEISRNSPAVEAVLTPISSQSTPASNMTQGFTETQRRELMTMMQEFWTQRSVQPTSSAPAASSSITQALEPRPDRWNAADLGFFDPSYEGKTLATAEPMQHSGKDTFFRDIHLFIDRAKDIAVISKEPRSCGVTFIPVYEALSWPGIQPNCPKKRKSWSGRGIILTYGSVIWSNVSGIDQTWPWSLSSGNVTPWMTLGVGVNLANMPALSCGLHVPLNPGKLIRLCLYTIAWTWNSSGMSLCPD